MRRFRTLSVALLALAMTAGPALATTLKLATLAPKRSAWGKLFEHMAAELGERTGNQLAVDIFDSGVQGDEKEVVEKMKSGQLQMAAITVVGLAKIVPDTIVFQLPGLYDSPAELDRVRTALAPQIEASMEAAGFILLGWGDVGPLYIFSNTPVVAPDDLKKTKFWTWTDDPVGPAVARLAGTAGVPLGVPSVTSALANGKVDAYLTSPLAGVSLRWYNRSSHINPWPAAMGIGAVVMAKPAYDALPADQQKALREVAAKWSTILTKKVRQDNTKTLELMAGKAYDGVKVSDAGLLSVGARKPGVDKPIITPVPADAQAKWRAIFVKVQDELAGKVYSQKLLDQVRGLVK
ncbi:MAG: TRAP transporter substrate-binding protein DctP [Deltaproteobacteria bacterium]|nr:TRAP transporter substrate-binding protein DctP [Deltaproteobacteria bacterium]MCB9787870.1 TRAP transporter substrate-binding protein DctP [Deltaproteobacteria bacterium]